ncbi:hypothetical protein BT96DRAFT_942291 [Gymnopus androsaceus JB14]|uniref:DNase I-like protein n=1 Tax=Gymnopus androsaceus JB14 TaxID=1447944 RepID=A0A6A4HD90_9AGAR|nr:hypothetical protein BT96DRAFT_942291 [Gymnopus androsaceus JB14]
MGENKIGIALVQETHMTENKQAETEHVFKKWMKIFSSNHPTNPTATGGVAVVLNRQLVKTQDAEAKEIIPGRALLVKLKWHLDEKLTILVVYVPNVTSTDRKENTKFWEEIQNFMSRPENQGWKPDVMAGDCNMVEDPIDRLPIKTMADGHSWDRRSRPQYGLHAERSEEHNPQKLLAKYIKDVTKKAREIEKSSISTYQSEEERKPLKSTISRKGYRKWSAAKDQLIGKTICKEWVRANKEQKPRDLIYALEKLPPMEPLEAPAGGEPLLIPRTEYVKEFKGIAKLGGEYHNSLQLKGLDTDPEEREQAIRDILGKIDVKLTEEQTVEVGKDLQCEEIEFALKQSKNGLTYEFWKSQVDVFCEDKK